METINGNTIDPRNYRRTKYASAFTEYLSDLAFENMERGSGDVECPTGYFVRLGRRILFTDSRGFVWHETYNDEQGAEQVYDALERYWVEWDYVNEWNDEADRSEAAQMLILAECDEYLSYVIACDAENLPAHDFDMWQVHGRPIGPI